MLSKHEIRLARADIASREESLPLMFNALSDMGRFRIFKMLLQRRNLCVTDVARVLEISVPAASQQLRVMEQAGLVRKKRMGQMMCYSVCNDELLVKSIIKLIT